MSEWQQTSLGKICTFRAGNVFKPSEQGALDGDIPFIKVSDMNLPQNHTRIQSSNNWVSASQAVRLKLKPFSTGTVVFAKIGEALKQNRVRLLIRDTAIDNNMMGAIPNTTVVDPNYFFYLLNTVDFAATATGTALPYLTVATLSGIHVQIPEVVTQRAIAAVLDQVDDLIESNRRRVELLEQMARAIYREWFVHFRYPGHEEVPLVDSALGPIPQGWDVMPVSKAISINPRIKLDKTIDHPFISMGDLDERGMSCRPSETRRGGSGSKFEQGDTLFARITPCLQNGKTGFVQSLSIGEVGIGSTEFLVFRGAEVGKAFTYCLARENDFRQHAIASMSGASGRQRVRNECFDSYEIAVPPRAESDSFETTTAPLFTQVRTLHDENEQLASLRDMLLPKLVTGQIDVSELDLEKSVGNAVSGASGSRDAVAARGGSPSKPETVFPTGFQGGEA